MLTLAVVRVMDARWAGSGKTSGWLVQGSRETMVAEGVGGMEKSSGFVL